MSLRLKHRSRRKCQVPVARRRRSRVVHYSEMYSASEASAVLGFVDCGRVFQRHLVFASVD